MDSRENPQTLDITHGLFLFGTPICSKMHVQEMIHIWG